MRVLVLALLTLAALTAVGVPDTAVAPGISCTFFVKVGAGSGSPPSTEFQDPTTACAITP